MTQWSRLFTALLAIATLAPGVSAQQEAAEPAPEMPWSIGYELPSNAVQQVFAQDKNYATLNTPGPEGRRFLVVRYQELSTLARMAEPTQRLAGLELRGQRNRTWRLDTYGVVGASVFDIETGTTTELQLPDDSGYSDFAWSHDGDHLVVTRHGPGNSELWRASAVDGSAERLGSVEIQATLASRVEGRTPRPSLMTQMTPSGDVVTLAVPADRGSVPARGVASGPVVRRTRGEARPNPTYPFLLEDAHEERLFRYYTTSQLTRVNTDGAATPLGEPAMFTRVSISPDGVHILTERLVEPLSPLVSYRSFGRVLEVRDGDGNVLATLRETPLSEGRSDDEPRDLPREVQWLPDGSGLAWLQREPDDDEDSDAENGALQSDRGGEHEDQQDRIIVLRPPFALDTAVVVATTEDDLRDLAFDKPSRQAFATVSLDDDEQALHRWSLDGGEPVRLLGPWDAEDPLADPGSLLRWFDATGTGHVITETGHAAAFVRGAGYREDYRPRPFVDRVMMDGSGSERVFEGSEDLYESPLVPLDRNMSAMVIEREGPATFPNSWRWRRDGGFTDQLTANADPFPELTAVERRHFEYTRRDGLVVQSHVWMPVGWSEGDPPPPAMFWTYPSEYDTPEDYAHDAIRDWALNRFDHLSYLRWSLLWVHQGYALVHPDVPIVGEPYNDNYIQHLSDSLYAAIRAADNLGLVDPDRVGHGGHSYGAFATANLLTRTPYFRAGIAGDGAYNRTLTPMGFQREPRFVWQARDTYLEMSPFFHADHLDTPLLMYHGSDDNNTGTFPIQSRRFMQALQGLDKDAVLYEYPYESHGPRAVESYLDLWKRFIDFFDEHVRNAGAGGTEE